MLQAFYNSTLGMKAQQYGLDVISNNIANINTSGYRMKRAEFSALMENGQGVGVRLSSVSNDPLPIGVNPINFNLQEGYFVVENEQGMRFYTKDGDFTLKDVDGENFLATKSGEFVLDRYGNRILMPQNPKDVILNDNVLYPNGENGGVGVRFAVVDFEFPQSLAEAGNGLFLETENSGVGQFVNDPKITLSYEDELKSQNAHNLSRELVNLLITQRAFSLNSKALQIADEFAQMTNHLRY